MNIKITGFLVVFFLFISMPFSLHAQDEANSETAIKDAMNLSNEGKYNEAIEKLQLIISQQSGVQGLSAHEHLGFIYFKTKQYPYAISEFEQSIAINKDAAMAYYYLGLIYEAKAINEKNLPTGHDLLKKALQDWEEFLRSSDLPGEITGSHNNMGVTPADKQKFAKRHIRMIKEELENE